MNTLGLLHSPAPEVRDLEYCSLVESVRRDKCRQYHPERWKHLSPVHRDRDWAVPTYDITDLFRTVRPEENAAFNKTAQDYIVSDDFVLPHDRFAIIARDGGAPVVVYVARSLEYLVGGLAVDSTQTFAEERYFADVWQYWAPKRCWSRQDYYVSTNFACLDGDIFDLGEEAVFDLEGREAAAVCAAKLAGFLLMLSHRNRSNFIRLCPIPASPSLVSTNEGRAFAKSLLHRPSIPETKKVLYVSKEPITKVVLSLSNPRSIQGAKSPHDRASHPRWIKGRDKPIIVKSCKIHGGAKTIPPTTIVRLIDEPED